MLKECTHVGNAFISNWGSEHIGAFLDPWRNKTLQVLSFVSGSDFIGKKLETIEQWNANDFTLMRMRILLLVKVMRSCDLFIATYPLRLHFEPQRLNCERTCLLCDRQRPYMYPFPASPHIASKFLLWCGSDSGSGFWLRCGSGCGSGFQKDADP